MVLVVLMITRHLCMASSAVFWFCRFYLQFWYYSMMLLCFTQCKYMYRKTSWYNKHWVNMVLRTYLLVHSQLGSYWILNKKLESRDTMDLDGTDFRLVQKTYGPRVADYNSYSGLILQQLTWMRASLSTAVIDCRSEYYLVSTVYCRCDKSIMLMDQLMGGRMGLVSFQMRLS